MKQNYFKKLLFSVFIILGTSFSWSQITFDYTGDVQTYVVPPGVTLINVQAYGAEGGTSTNDASSCIIGGWGGFATGNLTVVPGETLYIYVGGEGKEGNIGGWNGGGTSCANTATCAKGGGASDIRQGGTDFSDRVIVAGGGGGAEWSGCSGSAGDGGGLEGEGGAHPSPGGRNGGGGTQIAGGVAGTGGYSGSPGVFGVGGASGSHPAGHSGSGGGGWYGGGGSAEDGHGGGGSSYIDGLEEASTEAGVKEGDGQIVIEVLCSGLIIDIPITGVCIGDPITLTAESATGGVITWDGGVINGEEFFPPPGATTYTATSSSDADCAYEVEITASEVPDIEAHSSLPTACEGAIITLWGTGGDMYEWTGDGEVTPIDSVGFLAEEGEVTYTLDGSYLGCHADPVELTLVGAPQPEVVGEADPSEACLGTGYTVTGTGSGAESYYWGGGITDGGTISPETPGTYVHMVVGVSDVGCYDTSFVTVNVHALPVVNGGSDITVCEGNEVTLTATGAISYEWDPTAENGVAFVPAVGTTVYTVEGTDANECVGEDMVTVTVVDLPEIVDVEIVDEYFGYDGSIDITVEGGSGEYTYQWSHGPFSEDVDGLTDGVYTVQVDDITIDPGKCPVEATYVLTSYSGIEDESVMDLDLYPNPTTDLLTVQFEGQFTFELTSLSGQVILTGNGFNQEQISMDDLADGTYIIKVTSDEMTRVSHIVKN